MNITSARIPSALFVALLIVLSAPLPAAASTKKTTRVVQHQETHPAYDRTPSREAVTTRERRLKRECKGRPNAGACLGFAS